MRRLRKRALVVILSNLRDEDDETLLPALRLLGRRHLVLFASLRENILSRALTARVDSFDRALTHAAAADYLIAGTMFPTSSKPSAVAWLGGDGLQAIVRAVRVPVLAIGGIGLDRVATVAAAGAAGIAAIGLFLPGGPPIGETVESVCRQFDSVTAAF